jgi:creatinine amidohydrolase/Fe(II)-dependent formamide hydrolase-like protein
MVILASQHLNTLSVPEAQDLADLASVAKAASVSPAEGKALVEAIAAEASEAIEDMYEIEMVITETKPAGTA